MKILQICNKSPYPANDGGTIAIMNLAFSFTRQNHQVTLLSMKTPKHPGKVVTDHELPPGISFHTVTVNTRIRPVKLLFNLFFSSMPYSIERFKSTDFALALSKLLSEHEFDIIQLEGLYLTPYIPLIREKSKALISYRAHNVEHEIWDRITSSSTNPIKKFYFNTLTRRLKIYEKQIINSYDLLLPVTARDCHYFNASGNIKPCKIIPVGILTEHFSNQPFLPLQKDFFFIGALDWIPNQDGLTWFIGHVWKKFRLSMPSASFHIGGRNAPLWLVNKFRSQGILYHGEIINLNEFYNMHAVMIVPLFSGSGMRVKIVEALSRSKVIISTSMGAEGLEQNREDPAFLTADDSEAFIAAMKNILEDDTLFVKIERNAYLLAQSKYQNDSIVHELINFYLKHIS